MHALFAFLGGTNGRVVRALAGLALILIGLLLVQGAGGWILAIIGLAPLAAGVFDFCIFAPLFGLPFLGPSLRKKLDEE
jgi:hypothetical protein